MSRKKAHRIPLPEPMTTGTAQVNKDPLVAACDAVRKLGHISMRCARSIECWQCALTGSVRPGGQFVGEIFKKECGQ